MKTTMLKFPKNNAIALKKVKELEEIAGIDFCFTEYQSVIVLFGDGTFENFDSREEAIEDFFIFNEEYIRGDRKISKKVKEIINTWLEINKGEFDYEEDEDVPEVSKADLVKKVKGFLLGDPFEEKGKDDWKSLVLQVTKAIEKEIEKEEKKTEVREEKVEEPKVADAQTSDSITQLLHSIFGEKIPDGVGVHITKPAKEVAPIVAYETTSGDTRKLTLRDLQLLALLFGITKELQKANLNGISLSIEGNTIGPDDAKLPFSIAEIEAVIKMNVDQE